MHPTTGVDMSKILGGQTKILGGKVVKSDKFMGVPQLLGARDLAAIQVYAYAPYHSMLFIVVVGL